MTCFHLTTVVVIYPKKSSSSSYHSANFASRVLLSHNLNVNERDHKICVLYGNTHCNLGIELLILGVNLKFLYSERIKINLFFIFRHVYNMDENSSLAACVFKLICQMHDFANSTILNSKLFMNKL